jgi:hypothetical protein
MTRYKLPEALGGGEVIVGERWPDGRTTVTAPMVDDGTVHLRLPLDLLTEVAEPLPEEPPIGSVVRAQLVDEDEPRMWQLITDHDYGAGWYAAGLGMCFEWAALCKRGTPVPLVPAPAPVDLPWNLRDISGVADRFAMVQPGGHLSILTIGDRRESYSVVLAPTQARDMARALWTAADRSGS